MSPPPSVNTDGQAFADAVAAIAPDMPLLLHGSGDVPPNEVNPETAKLVAELTVQYISDLVNAAVDAHDVLTDGAGGFLPPPPFPNKRKMPPRSSTDALANKRQRKTQEYWDEPLREPKIRSETFEESNDTKTINSDEWVGLAGVDFFEDARSRRVHVSAPSTIGIQSFIFPVCHDAALYGRVMEIQAARRNIAPVLMDTVWLETMAAEGGRLRSSNKNKRSATPANDTENVEEEDEENAEEEILPMWPGLESLLPIHREE